MAKKKKDTNIPDRKEMSMKECMDCNYKMDEMPMKGKMPMGSKKKGK